MSSLYTIRLIVLLIIGLLWPIDVHAQKDENSNSGVEFRVLTFDRIKNLAEIDLVDGQNTQVVKMHKNNFSGPFKSSSRVLQFYQRGGDGLEEKNKDRVSAGMIKIPEHFGSQILLIAVPGKKQTYQFIPIADSFHDFHPGEMKLINLTDVLIATKLNNLAFQVAPYKVANVGKLSKKQKPHSYPVEFYTRKEKKWIPISSSFWQHEPDVRNLTFCYVEPRTGRIRIRTIRELPKVESQEL